MDNIVIIGSSRHAKVVIDVIERENKYNIVGLIDKFRKIGEETLGYKIIGKVEDIPIFIEKYSIIGGIIAIGDNWIRKKIYEKIITIEPRFKFIKAIHPNAQIAKNVKIGKFTAISLGANIINDITIKEHTIIGAGSLVVKDIPEFVVAYGVPAKVIRERNVGEKYL